MHGEELVMLSFMGQPPEETERGRLNEETAERMKHQRCEPSAGT